MGSARSVLPSSRSGGRYRGRRPLRTPDSLWSTPSVEAKLHNTGSTDISVLAPAHPTVEDYED